MTDHPKGPAMPITRTFTVEDFDELDIPYARTLLDTVIEMDDERELHELVFELEGIAYRVYYRRSHNQGVWWDDDEVQAVQVELVPVTVQKWMPVKRPVDAAVQS